MNVQLCSRINTCGELEISLRRTPLDELAADEVEVRVEASPINPSDVALLFGGADLDTICVTGSPEDPIVTAQMARGRGRPSRSSTARLDQWLPVGNEGAGVVVRTGSLPSARALQGKTVAMLGGAMYARFRKLKAADCLLLPAGTRSVEGASCFVNPLTALGMVETMRIEGHAALVNTAAASNLGQILNRICKQDGVALVNIVRKAEQEDILREQGARYVCNSSSPAFAEELTQALAATGATIAFDAVGGGRLATRILTSMEAVATATMTKYSVYGSATFKQVYIYGALDRRATELTRRYGMTWGVGGWLLRPFLDKIGPASVQRLHQRVVAELKTTFASHYAAEVSLVEALQPDVMTDYAKFGTARKYLINPSKD